MDTMTGNKLTIPKADNDQDLERTARLFDIVSGATKNLVALLNDSGEFSYVSPSVEEMSGYTPEEIYEMKTFTKLLLPEDATEIGKVRQAFLNGELTGEIKRRCQIIRKDGRRDWCEVNASLVPSVDNPGKKDLLITARQITALVSAEEELEDSRGQLERSLKLFRMLADEGTDAVALRPQFGNYYYMSLAWERQTGYTLEQLTAKGHPKFKLLHPDDLPTIAQRDEDMKKYGDTREYPPIIMRWYHRDGTLNWGEMATILLPSVDDPDALDVLVSIHNITESVKAQEELTKSRDKLADLADKLDSAKQEAESNLETIQRDIAFAASVQEAILPPSFPADPRYDIDGFMQAARTVGGDFYDFYLLGDNTIGFAIADVANKGVSAALFMAVSSTLLEAAAKSGASPALVMADVNHRLNQQNPLSMFVSVFYAVLDLETGIMRYCNAGHNPPVMVRNKGDAFELPLTDDTFLGMLEDVNYKEQVVQLEPGDTLFLYTDGVTEAENEERSLFGEKRLVDLLENTRGHPIPHVLFSVKDTVANFAGSAEQSDDLTALCIRYN